MSFLLFYVRFIRSCRWSLLITLNYTPLLLPFTGFSAFGAAPGFAEGGPVADNTVTVGVAFSGGGTGRLHHP